MALCPAAVERWLVFWGDLVLEGEAELVRSLQQAAWKVSRLWEPP